MTGRRPRLAWVVALAATATLVGCGLSPSDASTPTGSSPTAIASTGRTAATSVEPSAPASTAPGSSTTTAAANTSPSPTATSAGPSSVEPTPTDPGSPKPTAASTGDGATATATLLFTGEVLMHQSLIDTALQNAGGRNFDFRPMFTEIRPLIAGADLAVCHLELPVIPGDEGMDPRYATPPQVIDALADAGFDRCSTASNHALDRGAAGSDATIAALARAGMTQHGTAKQSSGAEPTVLDVNGFKVTHLSYTEVLGKAAPRNQPWRLSEAKRDRILADVAKARKLGAEWIAVSIHDSDELHYQPTPNQKQWDHWLTDVAKVDLVVGTGSHVPEPEGAREGRYVLYGLGNLINWRLDARDSVLARVTIERQTDGSVRTRAPELIPTFTEEHLGYQVLDARKFHAKAFDTRTQADLRESFRRVDPYVDAWIPKLQDG